MALLKSSDQKILQERFTSLQNDVKLVMFTQTAECQYCEETRMLVEEIAGLSGKISVQVYDFDTDKDKVKEYQIDKTPAVAIVGDRDHGIRFYGIPAGYELMSLVEGIEDVSEGDSGLDTASRQAISQVTEPTHIQVFVTPTCPYCTSAVRMAHKLAMENENIVADMVEAMEFPQLSQKYGVQGVPKTVVNEDVDFVGALPEAAFVQEVLRAVSA